MTQGKRPEEITDERIVGLAKKFSDLAEAEGEDVNTVVCAALIVLRSGVRESREAQGLPALSDEDFDEFTEALGRVLGGAVRFVPRRDLHG